MAKCKFTIFFLFALLILFMPGRGLAMNFVGSKTCSECHQELYADWFDSGHHLQLRKAQVAKNSGLPLPKGYTWDDISYVIGGVNKKATYVDKEGFLITSSKDGAKAKTLYVMEDDSWNNYLPGEKKPFDCAYCHTTGYRSIGHQDDLPGITGTWVEDGIGCEACHGPGSEHAETPAKSMHFGDLSAAICEQCHQRGGLGQKPLSELGLIRHHDQITELARGPHKGLNCLNCHNPHKKATKAKRNCTICHSRMFNSFKSNIHVKEGIECVDCHMARVPRPAISRASYFGHFRTHLFKVNTDPEAEMFKVVNEGGRSSEFMKGFVTVEYVCLPCHNSQDKQWAAKKAKGFHK